MFTGKHELGQPFLVWELAPKKGEVKWAGFRERLDDVLDAFYMMYVSVCLSVCFFVLDQELGNQTWQKSQAPEVY